MKKRLTAILLTLALVLSLGPVSVWAAGGSGLSPDDPMAVPEEGMVIKGGTYYGISYEWFKGINPNKDTMYFSIPLPEKVTTVIADGFRDSWSSEKENNGAATYYSGSRKTDWAHYNVVTIDFSEAANLTTIKSQAAMGAPLTGVLDLSNTKVQTIEKSAFSGCTGLTGVILPDTLEVLGAADGSSGSVFNRCSGLEFVRTANSEESTVFELPDSLKAIGKQTFKDAFSAGMDVKVVIPESVETIGSEAFYSGRISQIVVKRQGDGWDSNYTGYDSKAFFTGNSSLLIIFNDNTSYQDYRLNRRPTSSSIINAMTHPLTIRFGDTGIQQEKLNYQSIQYTRIEGTDFWEKDTAYTLPTLENTPDEKPGYDIQWMLGSSALTNTGKVDTNLTNPQAKVSYSLQNPTVQFSVDGVAQANGNLTVELDDQEHTAGVLVSHPLLLEKQGSTEDEYVYFQYCWWDEYDQTPNGPRSIAEPDIFSNSEGSGILNRVKTKRSEIPIESKDHERISPNQYMVEIYGYIVRNGGKPELFYKSHYNFIDFGSDNDYEATVTNSYVFQVTVIEPKTITIESQDITAYTGGDSINDDSFPTARYKVTGAENVTLGEIVVTGKAGVEYVLSDIEEGEIVLLPWLEEGFVPKAEANALSDDGFDTADDDREAGLYDIVATNLNELTVETKDGDPVDIDFYPGTLTVRNVSDPDKVLDNTVDIAQPVVHSEDDVDTDDGIAVAVIPDGAHFYTNGQEDLGVLGTDTTNPDANPQIALLFDDILERDAAAQADTQALLAERAAETGHALTENQYEFKYLDLINEYDGNAWVSTDQDITIFWPYPEAVKSSYNDYTFSVLHFEGLHREYQIDTAEDMENLIDASNVVSISAAKTDKGVKFSLSGDAANGSFSPFALAWTKESGGSSGGGGGTTRYTITASAEDGGSISPSGSVRVARGSDKTFTIRADSGYEIADVLVDGESVGAVRSYTFENVREKHTIQAQFGAVKPVADPDHTGVSNWLNAEDHMAYLTGYPDGTFGPNRSMTRAEVAQMFYALLLDQDVKLTVSFSDVPTEAWYAKAVNTLASLGMVDGVGGGRFDPDRAITRAEFTTIAMGFAHRVSEGEAGFSDVSESDWFYPYVMSASQYGWIGGYSDGTFRPNNTITRSEVTTIVNNMLARAADKDYVDAHADSLRQFPDVAEGYWGYYQIMEAVNSHNYTKSDGMEDWTRLK